MTEPRRAPQGDAASSLAQEEPLIFEQSTPGRRAYDVPAPEVEAVDPADCFDPGLLRATPAELPEVSEPQVVRHFSRLSQWNYAIDLGMYPLGSCTMKYNPRVNEAAGRIPGFARLHPLMSDAWTQGALELMHALQGCLSTISGLPGCTLQPAAGAQGELTGLLVMRAWQRARGEGHRDRVLVPDSAHGTNPASSTLAGCKTIELKSNERGLLDPERVAEAMDEGCVGLMVTNPNTLGLFEERIAEVTRIVHERGGLVYLDGANMNAIQGKVRPGDMGIDVMHYNLHKTYSTPHGGGGPGAGPVCVREDLIPFLPVPRVRKSDEGFSLDWDAPQSIGKVKAFWGNFLVLVRAYAYIRSLGPEGVRANAENAVLNANYIRAALSDTYELAYDRTCMHECVFTDRSFKGLGVKTLDVAKRLIDYGIHPPTVYFPLNVSGALMIEPTESEPRDELDRFIHAMRAVHAEAESQPELLQGAPHTAFRKRLDEASAARRPVLRYQRPDAES